uniref:Uncharacterized protein n=1 Tax=Palpitomonas bilix TaxID=652834 RepID=A0A7S3DDW4_9EUKA|mmetsp:Transcript_33542/g.85840  ORF Transcript_33542/g.85840 Transcript_33542/m.85840 type:complete len:335 (+) Transcript_33542:37-1041(+)
MSVLPFSTFRFLFFILLLHTRTHHAFSSLCFCAYTRPLLHYFAASLLHFTIVQVSPFRPLTLSSPVFDMALVPWKYQNAYCDITKLPQRDFYLDGGPVLTLVQKSVEESGIGTAARVWDCAFVLLHYIWQVRSTLKGKTLLELGSGTGLAALPALAAGATVIFSDLPHALDFTRENVERNLPKLRQWAEEDPASRSLGEAVFLPLTWGSDSDLDAILGKYEVDIVIGADVVFWPDTFKPLSSTLRRLCSLPSPSVESRGEGGGSGSGEKDDDKKEARKSRDVLIAYRPRLPREGVFWRRVEAFATVMQVDKSELHSEFRDGEIEVRRLVPLAVE